MTSNKITMSRGSNGKYVYDYTATKSRFCVAANMPHLGRIEAFLIDTNLPSPVSLGFDQGVSPSLWLNVITGMKIRIVSESEPTSIVIVTD